MKHLKETLQEFINENNINERLITYTNQDLDGKNQKLSKPTNQVMIRMLEKRNVFNNASINCAQLILSPQNNSNIITIEDLNIDVNDLQIWGNPLKNVTWLIKNCDIKYKTINIEDLDGLKNDVKYKNTTINGKLIE